MDVILDDGIANNQDVKRFVAFASDVTVKDQMDLMARCWCSHQVGRVEPIEHQYVNPQTHRTETIRITGSPEYGIATVHDHDLIKFVVSQWLEAQRQGKEPTRRIYFTPYQFFAWINRKPTGSAYMRLREALHRLKTTNIETTLSFNTGHKKEKKQVFSWISEWGMTEENDIIKGVEVVVAEWLYESIQNYNVLTLHKGYFKLTGSIEKWLYLYALKASGGETGKWSAMFKTLYSKSASQQDYKHFTSTLRGIVKKNGLPGLNLSIIKSQDGHDMLHIQRTEKRRVVEKEKTPQKQLLLIEKTPLEEAWAKVLDTLRSYFGEAVVKSWFESLHLDSLENGTLSLLAPTRTIADRINSLYIHRIKDACLSVGQEVLNVEVKVKASKAA